MDGWMRGSKDSGGQELRIYKVEGNVYYRTL